MSDSLSKTTEISCKVQHHDPKVCPEGLKGIMAVGLSLDVSSESPGHSESSK